MRCIVSTIPDLPSVALAVITVLAVCAPLPSKTLDFATSIAPILRDKCLRCHQPENRQGDVSLATGDDLAARELVVPRHADDSYLMELVSPQDGEPPEMPKQGAPLSPRQVALLRQWIEQGADWPPELVLRQPGADKSWWSLQPLARVRPPWDRAAPERWRRQSLADWIASPANPLTPRVLANRLWHYHFGRGIVPTPSNFGYLGGRPSHPELLDWLAAELLRHDWQLKPLHRQIMLSECYQQGSHSREDAAATDAEARLDPHRLTHEYSLSSLGLSSYGSCFTGVGANAGGRHQRRRG